MAAKMQERSALSWAELQDFLAIAHHGKLGSAAKTLGVDPSTMGRRLRRLESRIGQTLFEQTRDGHLLTETGERLFVHVENMERAALPIEQIPSNGNKLSGLLRVSVSEGFGTWFMANHLPEFCAAHPDLTVELVANSGFLSPSKRETDVAIQLARPHTGPVVSRKLADYGLGLYASKTYVQHHAAVQTPHDLFQHMLIGYVPDLLYAPELRYLGEIHDKLEPKIRSSSINAQFQLIRNGAGIGVLPRFVAAHDQDLVPVLPEKKITRSFWLVTHRDTRQLRRVAAFYDWLGALAERERSNLLFGNAV